MVGEECVGGSTGEREEEEGEREGEEGETEGERETEGEEPVMVWAFKEWRKQRPRPRRIRAGVSGAMVGLWSSGWSLCVTVDLSQHPQTELLLRQNRRRHHDTL